MNSKQAWRTTSVAVRSDTDLEGVGNTRVVGDKVYRWVLNGDTAVALALGQAAFHKLSDGAVIKTKVYQCLTANLTVLGGIVTATDGLAANTGTLPKSYGWIQMLGANSSISVSGATTGGTDIASGEFLKGANAVSHLVRDSTTPTYQNWVQILTAVTTTTTPAAAYATGYIRCL